ncbi:hypothetical protein [Streptomyces sp. NBC_01304]|uniref:hypothetical protein n=1 Tax=Streptomyces sp. NBC_01304 TaxID=2903818 RepID=UPI002E1015F9|nr:hypothetical protein OG430_26325 [Streptomyces sp. NBC_01304]
MKLGITGHRGLHGETEKVVRRAISAAVAAYDPDELVGVSCLAEGPDVWFAEAVLDHGGRIEVMLPADECRTELPEWHLPVYDDLLSRASDVRSTGLREVTDEAHMAGSELLVDRVDELIAVWDGLPARGHGGTADVVAYAESHDVPVRNLWPTGHVRD